MRPLGKVRTYRVAKGNGLRLQGQGLAVQGGGRLPGFLKSFRKPVVNALGDVVKKMVASKMEQGIKKLAGNGLRVQGGKKKRCCRKH